MSKDDIQILHMQNNAYRDIITTLKGQINDYDRKIRFNEREIGLQLEEMNQYNLNPEAGPPRDLESDCTLCMGECNNVHD